ncbi:conserved hypothetical protein [Sanguibacter gelidistatuariae]|uniref:Lysylphosphatidylglycerol synthase TM region n=1 Tax=Sanguibacter gelidistatuariae TaxID=1814289 RepID=A0A1G6MVR8_9MICO|nr:conserved hypothetical protein [Sanguibacter gelidistatuariae]
MPAGRGGAKRWLTRRRIIQAVLVLGLAYVAIPLISELPDVVGALRDARPEWLIVAAAATFGGFVCAAVALRACAGLAISYRDGIEMQVAATFTGTATPASVGSLALGVQFLVAHGQPVSIATAVIGLQNIVQFLVHVVLLTVLALVGGSSVDVLKDAPSGWTLLVILGVALAVVGIALGVRRIRDALAEVWQHRGREAAEHLTTLVRSPRRLTASVLGAAGGTISSAVTLWAVLIAVDAGSHPVTAAFATMVGATLASAAPTPGGIGAVEAALVASLTALGINPGTALAATFGYRIIATWIPTCLGWFFYNRLQRRGMI